MRHIYKLAQDLEDMLRLDTNTEDLKTNPEAKKAAKEVKKIQKQIKKLDEAINPKTKFYF